MTSPSRVVVSCVLLAIALQQCLAQFGCSNQDNSVEHYYQVIESKGVGESIGVLELKGGLNALKLTPEPNRHLALNQTTCEIYITAKLDFEKVEKLRWTIKCEELKSTFIGELSLKVTVIVMDDNDNVPVFKQPHYYANVSEALREGGTVIAGISATDRDRGGQQVVTFAIVPGPFSEYFDIPLPLRGEVKLVKKLDYENVTRVDVVIKAQDEHPKPLASYANLTVFVQDEDDMNPSFSMFKYTATVSDKHPQNEVIITDQPISAKDGDITINAPVIYSILWDSQNALSIHPTTASIKTTKPFQAGAQVVVLKAVQADNADRYATAILDLNVTQTPTTVVSVKPTPTTQKVTPSQKARTTTRKQMTSSDPTIIPPAYFPQKLIPVNVREDFPIGHVIHVVGLKNNTERTSLWLFEPVTSSAIFDVHPRGAISLVKELTSDSPRQYDLRIRVTDQYSRTQRCDVVIRVLDIKLAPYVKNVHQQVPIDRKPNVPVASIEATAKDQQTVLSFSLPPPEKYFSINDTGAIFTTTEIIKMKSEIYTLLVVVSDNGAPPMTTVARVTFTLPTIGKLEETVTRVETRYDAVIALGVLSGVLFIFVVVLIAYVIRKRLYDDKRMSKVRANVNTDAAGLRYKHGPANDYTHAYNYDMPEDNSSDGATTVVDDAGRIEAINAALVSSLEDFGNIDIETAITPHDMDYESTDSSQRDVMKTFGDRREIGYTNGAVLSSNGVHHNSLMPWPHANGLHKSTSSELATTIAPIDDKPEITVYF